jgi:hypothetical protein
VTRARHHGRLVLVTLAVVGIGGACAPDTPPVAMSRPGARLAGYATMHDTMPEAIHHAKHAVVERPVADIPRSKSAEAFAARLERIPGTKDAWLSVTLRRRIDGALAGQADTVTLLMNCNADSLLVLDRRGRALAQRLVLAPGRSLSFETNQALRVRVFGLRPLLAGQRSETLVRFALGGDLVVRTPVD